MEIDPVIVRSFIERLRTSKTHNKTDFYPLVRLDSDLLDQLNMNIRYRDDALIAEETRDMYSQAIPKKFRFTEELASPLTEVTVDTPVPESVLAKVVTDRALRRRLREAQEDTAASIARMHALKNKLPQSALSSPRLPLSPLKVRNLPVRLTPGAVAATRASCFQSVQQGLDNMKKMLYQKSDIKENIFMHSEEPEAQNIYCGNLINRGKLQLR